MCLAAVCAIVVSICQISSAEDYGLSDSLVGSLLAVPTAYTLQIAVADNVYSKIAVCLCYLSEVVNTTRDVGIGARRQGACRSEGFVIIFFLLVKVQKIVIERE